MKLSANSVKKIITFFRDNGIIANDNDLVAFYNYFYKVNLQFKTGDSSQSLLDLD